MFVDEKTLTIEAGKGGDGAVLFRREKYVPRGGPDGGDGGKGGDVYVVGKGNLHALTHLAHVDRIRAEDGETGGHQRSSGVSGKDATFYVPLGTIIQEEHGGQWVTLGEITEEDQQLLLAKGGNGGWGNWHFRSSVQQTPHRANPGHPGARKKLRLVLKLIADIGLVGLPNAGKSTLLSVVSAARPKIADYPFTTLEPQLGVAEVGSAKERRTAVIADLPGLIEGASQGKGLGSKFLKHIERTEAIIHCISALATPEEAVQQYDQIRAELEAWSPVLAKKQEYIALTKIDAVTKEQLQQLTETLAKHTGKTVYPISAVANRGVKELLTATLK